MSLQTGTSSVTSDLDFSSTRLVTDSALENITEWRQFSGEDMFRSKLRLQIRIDDFRKLHQERNKSSESELTAYKTLQFYTYVTRVLLDDMSAIIRSSNGSSTWRYLVTYKDTENIERSDLVLFILSL